MAAEFVADHDAVADLGCGMMELEKHLQASTTYYPVDVVARDSRTIVCDFNSSPVPATPASAALCLGVLEYIFDAPSFLRSIRSQYHTLVLSYCTVDLIPDQDFRRSHTWVNDFSQVELDAILVRIGWKIERVAQVDDWQMLWRLNRA